MQGQTPKQFNTGGELFLPTQGAHSAGRAPWNLTIHLLTLLLHLVWLHLPILQGFFEAGDISFQGPLDLNPAILCF